LMICWNTGIAVNRLAKLTPCRRPTLTPLLRAS
jgi:hypothetical protein